MYFLQNATNQISQSLNPLQDISKTLSHTDTINTYLVIFTALLAIATIGFGLWDRRQQNQERYDRERAWMTIDGPEPTQAVFDNGEYVSWEKFVQSLTNDGIQQLPKIVRIGMKFTNTGIRPARNLKTIDWTGFDSITREVFENGPEKDLNMDFGPKQTQHYSYEIPWEVWKNLSEKPIFFALRISYEYGKRKKSYSGAIYKLSKGQYTSISSWYS